MFRKRLTSVILAMSLVCAGTVSTYADTRDEIASAQAEKSEAESSLAETNSRIDVLQSEKSELQSFRDDWNTQLTDLSNELTDLNNQIEVKKTEVEMAKASVQRAKIEEQSQFEDMKNPIRYMYEKGSTDFIVSLLETRDITDFLTRAGRIQEMTAYDRERLEDYKAAKAAVETQQATLED